MNVLGLTTSALTPALISSIPSSSTRCGSPQVPTAAQCSNSLSQPSICGPPSSPAWPWFGKADTYQSRSRPEQRREDPVRSGCHKRRTSTTDIPVSLMTSAGYRDLSRFGKLLTESHASLRDDYQVSVPELHTLIRNAQETPGVLGARLTRRPRRLRGGRDHSRRLCGTCVRRLQRQWTEGPVAVRRRTRADSDT